MQVLGFGDFYYELGVQIVEACLATRSLNGGLMEMKPLMRFVNVSLPCLNIPFERPTSVALHRDLTSSLSYGRERSFCHREVAMLTESAL